MGKKNVKRDEMKVELARISKRRQLPILTLDERWHQLFPEDKKTATIKRLEKRVNDLLKQQGKLITEAKDMKKLKASFMTGIVNNMQQTAQGKEEEIRVKKLQSSQKYIKEINEKLAAYDEQLEQLPREISSANEQLMEESLKLCYSELSQNRQRISIMHDWIMKVREKLKETLVNKQELEQKNADIYTYMHDILGPEIIELFDADHKDF